MCGTFFPVDQQITKQPKTARNTQSKMTVPEFTTWLFLNGKHCFGLCVGISTVADMLKGHEKKLLTPPEYQTWLDIRAPNYSRSWLAGRFAAKYAGLFSHEVEIPLATEQDFRCDPMEWNRVSLLSLEQSLDSSIFQEWEIVSRNDEGKGIRPTARRLGEPVGYDLSISHSDFLALALWTRKTGVRIGCDIVPVGSVKESVTKIFFQGTEQDICSKNDLLRDKIWAVKETAYKALGENIPFHPMEWVVLKIDDDHFSCRCVSVTNREILVSTSLEFEHVLALGIAPASAPFG